jgi:predicted transcriptional regulator
MISQTSQIERGQGRPKGETAAFEEIAVREGENVREENVQTGEARGQAELDKTVSVELSSKLQDLLNNLARSTGSSASDLLSKGLVLMGVALKAKEHGLKLGIADDDGKLVQEIIGF